MLIGHSLADANGTLLAVDASLCEILQREERELVGLGYQALTHPDDCVRNTIIIAKLRIGATVSTIRKRYLLPDGSVIWASVQASRLQGSGHIIGTIQLPDAGPLRSGPERLWKAALIEEGRVQRRAASAMGRPSCRRPSRAGWCGLHKTAGLSRRALQTSRCS